MYFNKVLKKNIYATDIGNPVLQKSTISGTVNELSDSDKTVIVYDKDTAKPLASTMIERNSRTWNVGVEPTQADNSMFVVCLDNGEEFNGDIYDRVSLCSKEYAVPPGVLSSTHWGTYDFINTGIYPADIHSLYEVSVPNIKNEIAKVKVNSSLGLQGNLGVINNVTEAVDLYTADDNIVISAGNILVNEGMTVTDENTVKFSHTKAYRRDILGDGAETVFPVLKNGKWYNHYNDSPLIYISPSFMDTSAVGIGKYGEPCLQVCTDTAQSPTYKQYIECPIPNEIQSAISISFFVDLTTVRTAGSTQMPFFTLFGNFCKLSNKPEASKCENAEWYIRLSSNYYTSIADNNELSTANKSSLQLTYRMGSKPQGNVALTPSVDWSQPWHHIIVCVVQQEQQEINAAHNISMSIYLDGTLVATPTVTGTAKATSMSILFANYFESTSSYYTSAKISDLRVFSREVSATDIDVLKKDVPILDTTVHTVRGIRDDGRVTYLGGVPYPPVPAYLYEYYFTSTNHIIYKHVPTVKKEDAFDVEESNEYFNMYSTLPILGPKYVKLGPWTQGETHAISLPTNDMRDALYGGGMGFDTGGHFTVVCRLVKNKPGTIFRCGDSNKYCRLNFTGTAIQYNFYAKNIGVDGNQTLSNTLTCPVSFLPDGNTGWLQIAASVPVGQMDKIKTYIRDSQGVIIKTRVNAKVTFTGSLSINGLVSESRVIGIIDNIFEAKGEVDENDMNIPCSLVNAHNGNKGQFVIGANRYVPYADSVVRDMDGAQMLLSKIITVSYFDPCPEVCLTNIHTFLFGYDVGTIPENRVEYFTTYYYHGPGLAGWLLRDEAICAIDVAYNPQVNVPYSYHSTTGIKPLRLRVTTDKDCPVVYNREGKWGNGWTISWYSCIVGGLCKTNEYITIANIFTVTLTNSGLRIELPYADIDNSSNLRFIVKPRLINDHFWHNFVFTVVPTDNGYYTGKLYVDGCLYATATRIYNSYSHAQSTSPPTDHSYNLNPSGNSNVNVDAVRVYPFAFSDEMARNMAQAYIDPPLINCTYTNNLQVAFYKQKNEYPLYAGLDITFVEIDGNDNGQSLFFAFTQDNINYYVYKEGWVHILKEEGGSWVYLKNSDTPTWTSAGTSKSNAMTYAMSYPKNQMTMQEVHNLTSAQWAMFYDKNIGILDYAVGMLCNSSKGVMSPFVRGIYVNGLKIWLSPVINLRDFKHTDYDTFVCLSLALNPGEEPGVKLYAHVSDSVGWMEMENFEAVPGILKDQENNGTVQFMATFDVTKKNGREAHFLNIQAGNLKYIEDITDN